MSKSRTLKVRGLLCLGAICAGASFAGYGSLLENVFSMEGEELRAVEVARTFRGSAGLTGHVMALDYHESISGAALCARVHLFHDASLARVVLIDDKAHEHLMYEVYSLLVDEYSFTIKDACEETKLLHAVRPVSLRIELMDAEVMVEGLRYRNDLPLTKDAAWGLQREIRQRQIEEKIDLVNRQIKKKGMNWVAGETVLSRKTYEEKKELFARSDILPGLQGFEFYQGGVFELKSNRPTPQYGPTQMIGEFDWRNRHGADDPNSPYYDGDELGSGWVTPIKNQGGCGSCWAHAAAATAELATNLYYNRHIDLDLSEQYIMDCSEAARTPGEGCNGGWPFPAATFLVEHGVPEEECFPYQGSNAPVCEDACATSRERLQFAGLVAELEPLAPDELKKLIIQRGSVIGEVASWLHDMNLVGYKTAHDGEMIMIFKNSFGLYTGENGFTLAKIALDDFLSITAYVPPVISLNYTDADIRCLDMDNDGYCNWGIGPKAATCPESCRDEADCDDSRENLGPMLRSGSCQVINNAVLPESEVFSVMVRERELIIGAPGEYRVSLLDLTGREVYIAAGAGPGKIALPELKNPGIYFIAVKTAGGSYREKVMLF